MLIMLSVYKFGLLGINRFHDNNKSVVTNKIKSTEDEIEV